MQDGPVQAFLGLGSNLGRRATFLHRALDALETSGRVEIVALSSLYETEPVGYADQPWFLNLVAEIRTTLPARELLQLALSVEARLGRVRLQRWGPRTVDIDLLLYGDLVLDEPGLIVPHPRLAERAFVLVPLTELAPGLVLPDGRRLEHLLQRLSTTGQGMRRDGRLQWRRERKSGHGQ